MPPPAPTTATLVCQATEKKSRVWLVSAHAVERANPNGVVENAEDQLPFLVRKQSRRSLFLASMYPSVERIWCNSGLALTLVCMPLPTDHTVGYRAPVT